MKDLAARELEGMKGLAARELEGVRGLAARERRGALARLETNLTNNHAAPTKSAAQVPKTQKKSV